MIGTMDYNEAINYIEEKSKLGQVPGLDNIKELLNRLGNPQDKCRCLHIAGTNGKGSIFAFVENVLLEAGFKVGRYVSPAVVCYLEQFQLNQKMISEERFAGLLTKVADVVEEMTADGLASPTAFEIETALAFLFFQEEKVDYALIECGMGGALDATNVIQEPVVSVISSIGMDHMQFLGDTLSEIALQKAGIIRPGGVCVSSVQTKEVEETLRKYCADISAKFIMVDENQLSLLSIDLEKTVFCYKDRQYEISLLGEYQLVNAATALEVVDIILNQDWKGETSAGRTGNSCGTGEEIRSFIDDGLRKTRWAGRMTKVSDSPLILVDGAHNEQAWQSLRKSIKKYFTNKKIIYIIGVLRDKEYGKMIDLLWDTMESAITITPDSPRALEKEALAELIQEKGVPVQTAENSEKAMELALKKVGNDGVIMVCGSLSFLSDYLKL